MSRPKVVCERCNKPDGIMEREVSEISVCAGPGKALLWIGLLCQICADHVLGDVRRIVRERC